MERPKQFNESNTELVTFSENREDRKFSVTLPTGETYEFTPVDNVEDTEEHRLIYSGFTAKNEFVEVFWAKIENGSAAINEVMVDGNSVYQRPTFH